ncbi:MAG: hypothetical protein IPP71_10275 [Bacteroidetes bacterium]|nr:hypothetical protein [Bacteroidota bacterium]
MEKKSFAFNVEVDNVWKIKSDETDLFEIRSIKIDIGYFEGAKPDKRGAIMAQLAILDYELFLSGSNDADGWLLKAWSSDNLILDDWITKIAGTEWSLPDGLSQLSLSNFSLSFHTGTKELAIAATVNGEIRIPLNGSSGFLEIKSLKFSFEKGDGATTISFEGISGLELTDSNGVKQEFSMNTTVIYESKLGHKNTGWKIEALSGGELDLVNLVSGLTSKFGSINSSLPETLKDTRYALKDIYLKANNSDKSWNFCFGGTCKYELAGNEGILKVGIDFTKATDTSYTYKFNGDLNIKHPETAEEYNFQLGFDKEPGSMFMVAKYKGELSLKKVVSLFSPKVAEKIPAQLNPTMQDAAFLVYKKNKKTNILLAIRLDFSDKGNEIDLSRLAFIGKYIPAKEAKMELGLDFFLSTANIPDDQQDEFNKVLSRLGIPMDFPESIDSGLTLNPRITAPLFGSDLTLPVTGSGVKSDQKKANSKTEWKSVKKKIGPVTIERAGLTMEEGKVKILLDAGIELGGFTFKMLGFGVKIPIKSNLDVLNEIDFGLDGLELKIERGNIKISGGFYKQSLALKNRNGQWVSQIGYVGEIRILIGPKSLTAYAGYVDIDGIPSFFIYAIALLPLGGPAEFFIDGFAGGFGINSRLNIPPIEDVRNFIMVRSAFGEPYFDEKDQNASLSKIFNDIPPELDVNWIAIGIKANHYKFIESFFLATVSFGNKVELDLLGIVRLKMPKGAEMLVKAELALHAHFVPDDGFLGIEGRLTDGSYILNPLARLSGGFAFYSWLSGPHKGDFVISLGGYHPQFKIPSHYPIVPRLALTYQLSSNIYIKASAYIALTPKMLMAGGRLEGLVDLDNIKASFVIEAHFLMNFKPFQYEIAASVAMGVSASLDIGICTLRKTWQITAGMELWGPEFGGFASIDLEIVEFTIDFGAPKALPEPISWQEFKDDFLPPSGDISKIFISDGIIKEIKSELYGPESPRYIVSPTALKIRVESSIPARKLNTVYIGKTEENKIEEGWGIGVAPMQLSASDFNPSLNVEFKKLSGSNDGTKTFKNDLLTSRVPSALWGTYRERSLAGPMLLPVNESDQPFVGLQFHPEKEISDRLPEIGSLSLTDVLKPSENIINLNPAPLEKSEQKVKRPNDDVGFFEILKSPERKIYDKLINIKGFSHLPPADLQTFMPWTTPGGITEIGIDQFEDAPYLSSMGARENLIKWNKLK